jgi:uncharacterized membrane protein
MPPRFGWRVVAAFLPLAVGTIGLYNNVSDWRSAQTLGQHLAAAGVLFYGPVGVALLIGWRHWRPLFLAFAASCTLVGALAPVVWGGASPVIGLIAGFSAAMLCAASFWAATMAFPSQPPTATPS